MVSSIATLSKTEDQAVACRLADLGKASALLISQGLRPGNKAADYVLRKIIREAFVLCQQTLISFDAFAAISGSKWASAETVQTVFAEESLKFKKGLERGKREYQKLISRSKGPLTEQDLEYLSSTFGLPKTLLDSEETKRKNGGGL